MSARGILQHIHARCTPGVITDCSTYCLSQLKPSVGWLTSSQPKTRTHPSVSPKKERPHFEMSANQGHNFFAATRDWKMAWWPRRGPSPSTSHRACSETIKYCDMVWLSQACHNCWTDCTLGGDHGRSLREVETSLCEYIHGIWKGAGLSSDAHLGWLLWLHQSNQYVTARCHYHDGYAELTSKTRANFPPMI